LIRVAHVTFDMRIGGAEQVIYHLVKETDAGRFEVSVLCLEDHVGPFGWQLEEEGHSLTTCGRQPGFDVSLVKKVHRFVVEKNIDVLHCHQYTPYVYGLLGSIGTSSRVIFTEHGRFYPDGSKLKRKLVNPLFNLKTDHITAISSTTKDALARFEHLPERKIRVIYNGIDGTRFQSSGAPSPLRKELSISLHAPVIGTVARLDPIKNHPMMIRSMEAVRKIYPEAVLIIVGDGPEHENLEKLTKDLGLTSHVAFPGFRKDTQNFYALFDIFLLTSFSEGTAMTLLEAMAGSLPCIVTDAGGNGEIVVNDVTGFVIPIGDDHKLSEKTTVLLENGQLRESMGRAGRKRFEDRFTVEKMVKEYEALYESCRQ
jgi:glycosyltransferase involved in cell wall biosynthesis